MIRAPFVARFPIARGFGVEPVRLPASHRPVSVVEFGATAGIVTLEDLLEEVASELLEESEDAPLIVEDDRSVVVRGDVTVKEVNDALDIDLPEGEEFETITGFVLDRAGRIVEEGGTIEYDGVRIAIEAVENARIVTARVSRRPEEERTVDELRAE